MVITSAHGCWNKTCGDIAYSGAPYGANASYAAEKAYVPTLHLSGIVPHLEIIEPSINFEPASHHIPNYYHAIFNCKPIHTDQNLNAFPLRSVLLLGYKY